MVRKISKIVTVIIGSCTSLWMINKFLTTPIVRPSRYVEADLSDYR